MNLRESSELNLRGSLKNAKRKINIVGPLGVKDGATVIEPV